jgi:hypothetical protein
MSDINLLVSLCLEELGPSNNFDNADADGITQSEVDIDPNRIQVIKYNNKQGFNLTEFCNKLKEYYSHNDRLINYISDFL